MSDDDMIDSLAAQCEAMTAENKMLRDAITSLRAQLAEAQDRLAHEIACLDGADRRSARLGDLLRYANARADRAEAALAAQIEKRKAFPVLGQRGASVDFQLVADHAEQANRNHYQTVDRLAARGGLSWCELFAVLHNQPWKKVDTNEAMIACRALEARYLAAVTHDRMLAEAREVSEADKIAIRNKALLEAAQVLTDEIDLARIAMPQVIPILSADRKAILALIEKPDAR